MIYLIKTSVFIEGDDCKNDRAVIALKIGYSKDERGDGRFNDYINAGLSFRILKTISGGSLRLETYLHNYFKDYSIESRSKEWYYYDEKIVDFFLQCEDISSLYNLFGVNSDEELLQRELDNRSYRYRLNLELLDGIERFRRERPEKLNENVYELLVDIQSTSYFTDKMRLLCSNNLEKEDLDELLSYLPEDIKNYYNILGPERCRSLKYRHDLLRNEITALLNKGKNELKEDVYEAFPVGAKISRLTIKQELGVIYKKHNINKTPKATDIQDYFDLKDCKINNPEDPKKRDKGFEILKIKEL